MKYVYIDESGDLGNSRYSSRYFVLAGIIVNNPKKLDNLIKNTYRKYKEIRKMNEIKGTTTPSHVKKDIFARLNNIEYHAENENNEFIKIVKNKSVEIICEDKEPI